jgi:hypothetical protein
MFTSLMSFTITATRRPSRFANTWLSSVVFPAPRNPDKTVTGNRSSTDIITPRLECGVYTRFGFIPVPADEATMRSRAARSDDRDPGGEAHGRVG